VRGQGWSASSRRRLRLRAKEWVQFQFNRFRNRALGAARLW